jgi:hypothetical protein
MHIGYHEWHEGIGYDLAALGARVRSALLDLAHSGREDVRDLD